MAQIGKFNTLEVVSIADFGVYLDGENLDTILLPKKQVPSDTELGDWLNVFIYLDSEDRLIATTDKPLVEVGQCALLTVRDVNKFGAFLDWGLPKDLLVPYGEQRKPMEVGQRHVVYLYIDEYTQRITGSAKLSNFLREESHNHQTGDRVELMVINRTDIGYKVIVDELYLGVVHNMDVLQPLKPGQRLTGYIKQVRDDKKLDISLQLQGQEARDDIGARILAELERNGGVLNLGDKSSQKKSTRFFKPVRATLKKPLAVCLSRKKSPPKLNAS